MNWFDVNTPTPMTEASVDSMYKVVLLEGGNPILTANLPQNFSLQLSSSWDEPYNRPLSEYVSMLAGNAGLSRVSNWISEKGAKAEGVAGLLGQSTKLVGLSRLVWQSGSHLEFTIPFVLRAYNDAKVDVLANMKALLKLVAPKQQDGRIIPPGPSPAKSLAASAEFHEIADKLNTASGGTLNKALGEGEILTLKIGNFLTVSPVIVESVSEEFDTIFDKDGTPLAVSITVAIKSLYTVTQDQIESFFTQQASSSSSAGGGGISTNAEDYMGM